MRGRISWPGIAYRGVASFRCGTGHGGRDRASFRISWLNRLIGTTGDWRKGCLSK